MLAYYVQLTETPEVFILMRQVNAHKRTRDMLQNVSDVFCVQGAMQRGIAAKDMLNMSFHDLVLQQEVDRRLSAVS